MVEIIKISDDDAQEVFWVQGCGGLMSDSDGDISDSGEGLWLKHRPGGDGSIALKHTQANQHGKGELIWVHRATGAKYHRPGAAIEEAKPETKTPAPMRKFLPKWKRPSPEMPKAEGPTVARLVHCVSVHELLRVYYPRNGE